MSSEKGFWVLSQLGKKVLRPGGKELTEEIIHFLQINSQQTVVEFAPGKGFTTELLLLKQPKEYFGIDIEPQTISELQKKFNLTNQKFILTSAANTGLGNNIADVVLGEAMLTMQADHRKSEIISEAFRVLKPGGKYAIHELGLTPEDLNESVKKEMLVNLSKVGRVNARPLTQSEWVEILMNNGFVIKEVIQAPMQLLELRRLIADEGLFGLLGIVYRLLTKPKVRKSVLAMKSTFQHYSNNLIGIGIIAEKPVNPIG
jgi:SAM-dependent methyltransferase